MKNEDDVDLGHLEFPSIEIDITPVEQPVEHPVIDPESFSDIAIETESNQMLVEGVTELKDHPQLKGFLEDLNNLKNDLVFEVEKLSKDFELVGSVKILFAIKRKE